MFLNQPNWDPMICHDGQYWWCYVLTVEPTPEMKFFFTKDNYINLFVSKDCINWENLGPVNFPKTPNALLNAGTPLYKENKFYFFLSVTIKQFSLHLMDQRIFLLSSENGVDFEKIESFRLEPDPQFYATKRYDPENGNMLYAWRDPFLFHDPVSGKYFLYIAAGAIRWGVPPKVAVAIADSFLGPYKLLPPALDLGDYHVDDPRVFFKEIERVHIHYRNQKYHMFFSTWAFNLSETFKSYLNEKGIPAVHGNVYHFISDSPEGPFVLHDETPVILCSTYAQLYGTQIINIGNHDILIGWNPKIFRSHVKDNLIVRWKENDVHLWFRATTGSTNIGSTTL